MDKRAIFLELPADIVEKIDSQNVMRDRSTFVSNMLRKQLQNQVDEVDDFESNSTRDISKMKADSSVLSQKIKLVSTDGKILDSFDVNSVEGFENFAKKINEISDNPNVRIRAKLML